VTYTAALAHEVEAIKSAMRSAGISESELARISGISQPHVHNVLGGVRRLTPATADALLNALGREGLMMQ
jgi:transcriptional regulator with XRE-family HTH domain